MIRVLGLLTMHRDMMGSVNELDDNGIVEQVDDILRETDYLRFKK